MTKQNAVETEEVKSLKHAYFYEAVISTPNTSQHLHLSFFCESFNSRTAMYIKYMQ